MSSWTSNRNRIWKETKCSSIDFVLECPYICILCLIFVVTCERITSASPLRFAICNAIILQVLDFVLFCILYLVISGIVVYSSLMVALRPLFSYCSKENSSWKFLSFSKLWTPLDISEVALACFDTFFSWEFGLSDDLMNFYIIKTLLFKI